MTWLRTNLLLWVLLLALCAQAAKKRKLSWFEDYQKWSFNKKGALSTELVTPFLGHGGTYESVQPLASKKQTIESDHAPRFSILDFISQDNPNVPDNIKIMLSKRWKLQDELMTTEYPDNEWNMALIKTEIGDLKDGIKKGTAAPGTDKRIAELEVEFEDLENMNVVLRKPLEYANLDIKNAMGVISIPYGAHRIFPSTGRAGWNNELEGLKGASADTAKLVMGKYESEWIVNMEAGLKDGYIKNADDFATVLPTGEKVYDYEGIWENNFDSIVDTAYHGGKSSGASEQVMKDLHHSYAKKFTTAEIYCVKTPETGYADLMDMYLREYQMYLKGDFDTYKPGLVALLQQNKKLGWIKAEDVENLENRHRLNDIDETSPTHAEKMNRWNYVEESIRMQADKSKNPVLREIAKEPAKKVAGAVSSKICSTSIRRKRSFAGSECIFYVNMGDDPNEDNNALDGNEGESRNLGGVDSDEYHVKYPDVEDDTHFKSKSNNVGDDLNEPEVDMKLHENNYDGLSSPRVSLPSDDDTVSIDSKQFNAYISSEFDDEDLSSVRAKQAVVDYVARNKDKLSGSPEDIAEAEATINLEYLHKHAEQNELARKVVGESDDDDGASPEQITSYDSVHVSTELLASRVSGVTSAVGSFQGAYGKIMLAKGIVTALRHGDYGRLAIIGGKVGLGYALKGLGKWGTHLLKTSAVESTIALGSKMEFLGEMAGPIGNILDIGMNIYSIKNHIDILTNPKASKYDKNDAIASIFADTVDIVVTSVALYVSLQFPPLAPAAAAAAFVINLVVTIAVGFYKASTKVDRINENIPLLDFEKTNEYWRSVVGFNTSGYLENLIDIKRANNIAVNMTVQFLVNNTNYIGRVFPAKTIYDPHSDCRLEKKTTLKFLMLSLNSSEWKNVSMCDGPGESCDEDASETTPLYVYVNYKERKCESDDALDAIYPFNWGFQIWADYRCQCGQDPPPPSGYDILDNQVHFHEKRDVYLERSSSDFGLPPGFEYQCKPSSLENEGKRVTNPYTNYTYYCKSAVAVRRKGGEGKFMLYDLGNGTDSVTLNETETVDNLFLVKDGHKIFHGNGGDDTFILDGPCITMSGLLDGKGFRDLGNSLVLGENCSPLTIIDVNLANGKLQIGSNQSVYLNAIHRVIGRANATDWIEGDCSTQVILGGGGISADEPDMIVVPSCNASDTFEMTASVEGSTILDATNFTQGHVFILVNDTDEFTSKVPNHFRGTLIVKFEWIVGNLNSVKFSNDMMAVVTLGFDHGGNAKFEFHPPRSNSVEICDIGEQEGGHITVLLNQTSTDGRQINCNLNKYRMQCVFVLNVTSNQTNSFHGYDFLDNVFQLISGNWSVSGGNHSNHFILITSNFSGFIDGGYGQGSLHLGNGWINWSPLEVDMSSGVIHAAQTIRFKGIQALIGRPGFIDHVITACDTTSIDLGGTAPDTLNIPASLCPTPVDIKISVKGNVTIYNNQLKGATRIEANIPLHLTVYQRGGGQMMLHFNFAIQKLLKISKQELQIEDGSYVKMQGSFTIIYFEEMYKLKSDLVSGNDVDLIAFHEITIVKTMLECPKFRNGSNNVANVFKLLGGAEWTVIGGEMDDTFVLENASFTGNIDGGAGKNSFVIHNSLDGNITIDTNKVWWQGRKLLYFENIHEVHGRTGKPEEMVVDCDLGFVNGNGGADIENMDLVTIPNLDCDLQTTVIVAAGFTKLDSSGESGSFNIYVQEDESQHLKFNSNILVTNETIFNIPIRYPAYKLMSYLFTTEEKANFMAITLYLQLSESENFVQIIQEMVSDGYPELLQNVNIMFVDDDFNSNGNILINPSSNELNVLHVLEKSESSSNESTTKKTRRGATGAKNIFRLNGGNWDAFGGTFDDSFILNDDSFRGSIHGLGGANSLVLADSVRASEIIINLPNKSLTVLDKETASVINVSSIQIVGGRKQKSERVRCACDTRLVMLEGGNGSTLMDTIAIPESFCSYQISIIFAKYTRVTNKASRGNFTYHVRTSMNFDIEYTPSNDAHHNFKLEIPLEQVKYIKMFENDSMGISFENDIKIFPLNFQNMPTFQFGESQELMADLILQEGEMPKSSVIARSPFSGNIQGLHGVENGIVVQVSSGLRSIVGGDKDDTIFLIEIPSISLIEGKEGNNRIQLGEELHQGKDLEIDLDLGKITFLEDDSVFIEVVRGIELFTGREESYEKIILGCDTMAVKFANEVTIRRDCGYNVRIEIDPGTRVIFDFVENNTPPDKESKYREREYDDEETAELERLEPSTFYYHFTSVQSFDIEIDSLSRLEDTINIFYLNFTLSDLKTLRFSRKNSRLIYTLWNPSDQLEYSHRVAGLDDFSMFYTNPEFMTADGFLLRITAYGEIIAVMSNLEEKLNPEIVHQEIIPNLSEYSYRMGISFMVETESEFIHCTRPNEIGVTHNRANKTSHLIGFNETRYEILDLDKDVFIFLQDVQEDSFHVLDFTYIVHQIRSGNDNKYIPFVKQVEDNFEIHMDNYTQMFPGKVVIINGTFWCKNIRIFLNTIAMELMPTYSQNRSKRSIDDGEDSYWQIKSRPITIPNGHTYFFAAADLQMGVEIREESESENATFEYSKHHNDLVITSIGSEQLETGRATTFTIFDYYSSDPLTDFIKGLTGNSGEEICNVRVMLGKEVVTISSNEPLATEAGEAITVTYYEDILERKEREITKDVPGMPRKYVVSWWRKISRTTTYFYLVRALILGLSAIVGVCVCICCCCMFRKLFYYRFSRHKSVKDHMSEYSVENSEDYAESSLLADIGVGEQEL